MEILFRPFCTVLLSCFATLGYGHPLKLSLSQIEYSSERDTIQVDLRLFLMDVNEALTFDPESTELRFCEPDESPNANSLLMSYLNEFISIEANGQRIPIKLENKSLNGEGINTALQISFEYAQEKPLKTLKIKNTVFTDLFFDQTNIIYVHINSDSTSLMLNKNTPSHTLTF